MTGESRTWKTSTKNPVWVVRVYRQARMTTAAEMKERLSMNHPPLDNDGMPAGIDFTKGVRGLHHIPPDRKVLMPAAAEVRSFSHNFFLLHFHPLTANRLH
jgi:hypothetical protein